MLVNQGDDLVQVIATANPGSGKTYAVPVGPNTPSGGGGLGTIALGTGSNGVPNATSVSPLTTYILNLNAPNRLYIDGATVYCAQSNANPTSKIENCTTTQAGGLTVHQGDPITADPIVPASTAMTTGLLAPDGIVGVLPGSYPGAPQGSTVVFYTQKILSYFIEGTTNASVTLPAAAINYTPSVTQTTQPLPVSGSFTVYLGTAVGQPIQSITCTGTSPGTGTSVNLTGCSGGTGTVASGNWIGGPNAATAPFSVLNQIGEGTNGSSKGPEKLFGNNEDLAVLRAAYTTDGVNFTDLGAISGTAATAGITNGAYTDVTNPYTQASPSSTSAANVPQGSPDNVELRWAGSRGTIITNPDGSHGMFLSGAWSTDGDSDAFNQIFYTSSTDGQHWTTPQVVLSTDYSFAASLAQDTSGGRLGISAYYSGRAYGPSVVQNPNGTLTMVFSGYRSPKPIVSAGTVLGNNASALYTVGANDPALYRNILTMSLGSSTSPGVATTTTVAANPAAGVVVGQPITYTGTVAVNAPGTGTANGTVSFSDANGPIAGCSNVTLGLGSPDTATCTTTYLTAQTNDQVTATYSGDSNYLTSTGQFLVTVAKAATTTALTSSDAGNGAIGVPTTFTATVNVLAPGGGTPSGTVSFSDAGGVLSGCGARSVSGATTGVATCVVNWTNSSAGDTVTATYSGDGGHTGSSGGFTETILRAVATTTPTGSVPSTLSLSVGATAPSLGAFVAGVAQTYMTSLSATVTTTAASSTLQAADLTGSFTGYLVNATPSGGPYRLAQGLQVDATSTNPSASGSGTYSDLSTTEPATLLTYAAPVANDAVTLGFRQPIAATDPLRTGTYAKTVTFTLSTSTP